MTPGDIDCAIRTGYGPGHKAELAKRPPLPLVRLKNIAVSNRFDSLKKKVEILNNE